MKRLNGEKLYTSSPYVYIPLIVRFKGYEEERKSVLALSNRMGNSYLRIILWVEIYSEVMVLEGNSKEAGPAFCDECGYVLTQYFLNVELPKVMT